MNSLIKPYQLGQLILAITREHLREPGVLFWGIAFPMLMSLGLGIAFTQKTDVIRKVAVIVPTDSALTCRDSLSVLTGFLSHYGDIKPSGGKAAGNYELVLPDEKLGNTIFHFQAMKWEDALVQLKRGSLNLILLSRDTNPEYHFDPLNSDAQLTYLKLTRVFDHQPSPARLPESAIVPLTVTGTRYIDFLIPGLLTMGVMMSCMWGISYGIIEKRSKKLLRRMIATPMKKSHFLIALITVRLGLNLVEGILLLLFAYLVFGITITGSIPAAILLYIAGNVAFAGIAILFSCNTSNTEVGNGLINAVVMPMMILSGIFFSYHNFPDWAIPYIQLLPLTLLADGIRSIFIEGAGFIQVMIPFTVLTATGIAFFSLGLKFFKWH